MPAPRARVWHAAVLQALLSREESPLARIVHHARAAGDDAAVVRSRAPGGGAGQHAGRSPGSGEPLRGRAADGYIALARRAGSAAGKKSLRILPHRRDRKRGCRPPGSAGRVAERAVAGEGRREPALALAPGLVPGPAELPRSATPLRRLPCWKRCRPAGSWPWPTATGRSCTCSRARRRRPQAGGSGRSRLAEAFGDTEIVVHALNNVGTGLLESGDEAGRSLLVSSLQQALAHDMQEHVARAYTNLGAASVTTSGLRSRCYLPEPGHRLL
jgi:hypothetical protein